MFNLKNYHLTCFKGHLVPYNTSCFQFISLCGSDFLVSGVFTEYLGSEVTVYGLPVWGSENKNELFLYQIEKSLKDVS